MIAPRTGRRAPDTETARSLPEGVGRQVRLIRAPLWSPVNRVQQLMVSALAAEDMLPWDHLVERVARELYLDEVSQGGWAVDIGVFGPRLFRSEVVQEIRATRNVLWEAVAPWSSTKLRTDTPHHRLD